MYCEVSITTTQNPLSACLTVVEWSFCKDFSAFLSFFVRFSVVCTGCISIMWSFAVAQEGGRERYLFWCVFDVLGCCRRRLESKREGSVFVKKEYWPLR